MSILVTYATSKGSTIGVAERLAEHLKLYASSVDCLPVRKVSATSLTKYSAIIVGSAVQMYEWLTPARNFIHDNEAVLKTKPVWAFSVGFPAEDAERVQQEGSLAEKIRKYVPDLKAHKFFYGRLRRRDLGVYWRLVLQCFAPQYVQRWGDERNWEEIEAWADMVGKEIRDGRSSTAI
ncbi:flavodoxin-like protein [Rhizodiscina lignyota]|uniref:Flavodoxin-like protein n=1 Tax=Rhizodiscina lignyota TaxID=1504668 RepID=A0A9P4M1B2_9PEZI|nr:flavodoxin-like protein [Rhizodiscina lignyota]